MVDLAVLRQSGQNNASKRVTNSRKTDDAVRRRRVAHDGLTTGALLLFCVALLPPIVTLSDPYDRGVEGAFILPA